MTLRPLRATGLALIFGLLSASGVSAASSDREMHLVSGGAAPVPTFLDALDNGSRVWFSTFEPLLPADTDAAQDVYERSSNGDLRLIIGNFGDVAGTYVGSSADGSRVWFTTIEALLPADTDTLGDIYELSPTGSLRLVTDNTPTRSLRFDGGASDGSRVWFTTDESLVPGDVDSFSDIYERSSSGVLRLVSPGGPDNYPVRFAGASNDGSRVWFQTGEALDSDDHEIGMDVYERTSSGALRLISGGLYDPYPSTLAGASADGLRVRFTTMSRLLPADTDTGDDTYERSSSGSLRLITSGTDATNEQYAGASSDGSRVWFDTDAVLVSGDKNDTWDVYERTPTGGVRLISGGRAGALDSFGFNGGSADGKTVWFTTKSRLVPADTDSSKDVYERTAAGALRLISGGTQQNFDAIYKGATVDGSRVWFSTDEPLVPSDSNGQWDVYERARDGALRLMVPGAPYGSVFERATRNGARVWLSTSKGLVPADTDGALDIYEARLAPVIVSRARVAGFVSVGSLLTCRTSIHNGETQRYVWRRDGQLVSRAGRYRISSLDLGAHVSCEVTATSLAGVTKVTRSNQREVPRRFTVPRTRGLSRTAAVAKLGNLGAAMTIHVVVGSGVPVGRVLGTVPRAGSIRRNGALVTILVRK